MGTPHFAPSAKFQLILQVFPTEVCKGFASKCPGGQIDLYRAFRAGRSRASQTPRAPDAAGAHRRIHRGAAGRASPASRWRRSVRTAAANGQKPTIYGLEAPGALRRTPHEAHAGETWHIALCWAVARVPAKSSGVICVHTPLAAGALVESGAENSRMREYGRAVH